MDADRRAQVMRSITERYRKTRLSRLDELESDVRRVLDRVTRELHGLLYRIEDMKRECVADDTTIAVRAVPPKTEGPGG